MPVQNIVDRERAEALIRDQLMDTIFQDAPKNSVVMQMARRLPNMTSKQTRVPVLSMLPMAYWVSGDTGTKQTSRQAGNNVPGGVTYDTILGADGLFGKVEQAGYVVDGVLAGMATRAALRGIKDDAARPIFMSNMQDRARYTLDGAPIYFPENGSFDPTVAQMVAGNWQQMVWAMRQDIETKILTEAVIQDPSSKEILYNLAQQDMIALRVKFRMGWAVPNPATRLNENRVLVPFAYIEPGTPVTTYTATFTVKDTSGNIEGAQINLNGSILRTNASGQAVFNLRNGEYPYAVSAEGYRKQTGTVTIDGAVQTPTITLVATK